MSWLRDNFHRTIDYIRISMTDRCNLRCIYCMPSEGIKNLKYREILNYEEIVRVARIAANLGVKKVRITGGEPLIRKNISQFISFLKDIEGIEDISMTTNGVLLERFAEELADAGLNRVNVSLDTFSADRYREITRGGDIHEVLRGITAAESADLTPVKINMVPIRGFNDDEIVQFARLTLTTPYQIRFIELMPTSEKYNIKKSVPLDEIMTIVESIGPIFPVKVRRSGPSRYFRFDGAPGIVGFISAITHHFCDECNRLRLTADGKLRPCLFSETEIDLRTPLRNNALDSEIERLLKLSIEVKPRGHNLSQKTDFYPSYLMSKIGG